MKNFLEKLRALAKRIAFWRKHAAEPLDLDQTLVIEKPGTDQLAAMPEAVATSEGGTPVLSFPASESQVLAFPGEDSQSSDSSEDAPETSAGPGLLQRLGALLRQKRVWIPIVGLLLLIVIGSVVTLILQSVREKEALRAELQQAKKQLQQQPARPISAAVAPKPEPVPVKSEPAPEKQELLPEKSSPVESSVNIRPDSPSSPNRTTHNSNPPKTGECVIDSKQSVAENLKNCIEDFNSGDKPKSRKAR